MGVCVQQRPKIGAQVSDVVEPAGRCVDGGDPAAFGSDPHVELLVGGEQVEFSSGDDDDRVGQIDGRWEREPGKRLVNHLTHHSACGVSGLPATLLTLK